MMRHPFLKKIYWNFKFGKDQDLEMEEQHAPISLLTWIICKEANLGLRQRAVNQDWGFPLADRQLTDNNLQTCSRISSNASSYLNKMPLNAKWIAEFSKLTQFELSFVKISIWFFLSLRHFRRARKPRMRDWIFTALSVRIRLVSRFSRFLAFSAKKLSRSELDFSFTNILNSGKISHLPRIIFTVCHNFRHFLRTFIKV